jgi:hypothetical protein
MKRAIPQFFIVVFRICLAYFVLNIVVFGILQTPDAPSNIVVAGIFDLICPK